MSFIESFEKKVSKLELQVKEFQLENRKLKEKQEVSTKKPFQFRLSKRF